MSGSLRYMTVESSMEILRQLYLDTREEFFTCTIVVPLPRADTVEDGTLQLDIKRTNNQEPDRRMANGDWIFGTRARFTGDTTEFDIDVVTRTRQADTVSATISMAGEALEIFDRLNK